MAYSPPILRKDPDDRLDFTVDWAVWLASTGVVDSIASVAWTVSAGGVTPLTIGSGLYAPTLTGSTATVWLLDGTSGTSYTVTCQVTTAAGRIKDFSFTLAVEAA